MSAASVAAGLPAAGPRPWHELLSLIAEVLREKRDVTSGATAVDTSLRHDVHATVPFPAAVGTDDDSDDFDTDELGDVGPGDAGPDRSSGESIDADHAAMWELVRLAQSGDGDAFGLLYDHYVDQVYRFIYYRVNDRALAEDFTSETFLRALRRITTINYQGRDIGAWFMTIARNIVFDHSKSARFRLEMSTGEDIESDERAPSPEMMVLANLTNARLLQAVNDLNDEQKECIALRFLHGLSVAETAEVMGKNDGAIKALQHRAVKRLATLLGDELR